MKKAILIVSALLLVVSGVAAVSAYEGHVVDIKAHVENAIWVEATELSFGTCFPEATKETDVWIGLSQSFQDQDQDFAYYSQVKYELWWEDKSIYEPDPNNPALDPDEDLLYEPIYPYITLNIDGQAPGTMPVTSRITALIALGLVPIGIGDLSLPVDLYDNLHLSFDPPVFDCAYNPVTDPRTPSGVLVLDDDDYVMVDEEFDVGLSDNITVAVPHADLGNNLKIQVYDIVLHAD